jgi:UDP-N-acetylglucosamine 2-epimerase (non-hydrolysing)
LGSDPQSLKIAINKLLSNQWKTGAIPKFWDGKTSQRIVEVLSVFLKK